MRVKEEGVEQSELRENGAARQAAVRQWQTGNTECESEQQLISAAMAWPGDKSLSRCLPCLPYQLCRLSVHQPIINLPLIAICFTHLHNTCRACCCRRHAAADGQGWLQGPGSCACGAAAGCAPCARHSHSGPGAGQDRERGAQANQVSLCVVGMMARQQRGRGAAEWSGSDGVFGVQLYV